MTKAMRLGTIALFACGLTASAMFAGCGDDDEGTPPPASSGGDSGGGGSEAATETGGGGAEAGTETGGGGTEAGTETGTGTEAGTEGGTEAGDTKPLPADRKITLVFAAPDLPPQFLCLGAFVADKDGMPTSTLADAKGPYGIDDGSGDPKKLSGFPYGAVVPIPVSDAAVKVALNGLAVIGFTVDKNPLVEGKTCKDYWKDPAISGDKGRQAVVKKGLVAAGTSFVGAMVGCKNKDADPACGGKELHWVMQKFDIAPPTEFKGGGETKLGIQFGHLSNFPAFQGMDVYVQGRKAGGGEAGTDPMLEGVPVQITTAAAGANAEHFEPKAIGVAIPGNKDLALLLLVKNGTKPFCEGAADCKTTVPIPIKPFMDAFKVTGATWGDTQFFGLIGRPKLETDPATANPLIIGISPTPYDK